MGIISSHTVISTLHYLSLVEVKLQIMNNKFKSLTGLNKGNYASASAFLG